MTPSDHAPFGGGGGLLNFPVGFQGQHVFKVPQPISAAERSQIIAQTDVGGKVFHLFRIASTEDNVICQERSLESDDGFPDGLAPDVLANASQPRPPQDAAPMLPCPVEK